jgi:hypothetical protein
MVVGDVIVGDLGTVLLVPLNGVDDGVDESRVVEYGRHGCVSEKSNCGESKSVCKKQVASEKSTEAIVKGNLFTANPFRSSRGGLINSVSEGELVLATQGGKRALLQPTSHWNKLMTEHLPEDNNLNLPINSCRFNSDEPFRAIFGLSGLENMIGSVGTRITVATALASSCSASR